MTKRFVNVLLTVLVFLGLAGVAQASTYATGDVFLGIFGGTVNEYTPNGTLVQTMNTTTGGFITGMAFDNSGNLYTTDFSANQVSQFNNSGTLTNAAYITGLATPESIAVDAAGNQYITQTGGSAIKEYSPTGTFIGSTATGRTDWNDLAADQHTMLYTDEGNTIHSVNVATNTANPDFATSSGNHYALRIIPGGTFAGDVLVANGSDAQLFSPTGVLLTTYTLPGNAGGDFALNLDPNGTDFWTADINNNEVWEVNIATGKIDEQWNPGTSTVAGLVVFGQITASGGGGGTVTPEPGTIVLFASGLIGLALAKWFVK